MSSSSEPHATGTRHEVCPVHDLPPGERRIVEVDGLSIGVFNVEGEFYALANVCPHQLAELCRGRIGGLVTSEEVGEYGWEREGEIVRCPRHKWAFDIESGESVFNPHLRTRTFEVEVERRAGDVDSAGGATEQDDAVVEHGNGEDASERNVDPETARQVEEYGTASRRCWTSRGRSGRSWSARRRRSVRHRLGPGPRVAANESATRSPANLSDRREWSPPVATSA